MTTAELMAALAQERPNGLSFDPMAVRLLRQIAPFDDRQVEDLKGKMFQLASGLWFFPEMIADDKCRLAFEKQALEWLMEYNCFSVEMLFKDFCDDFRHIVTTEDCAVFLRYLGFSAVEWGKGGYFCSQPPADLDDSLKSISETIAEMLEDAHGTLHLREIEQEMPNLTAEALESIRVRFLPDVHVAEVGGVRCWCSADSIHLPEDFAEKLTVIVDTLVLLGERVSVANLEFALNLFYRIRLREEYALSNNDTFMSVCAKHYRGNNNVFSKAKKPRERAVDAVLARILGTEENDPSMSGRRVRRPNARFRSLNVPIGAELVFTKDSHITCTVLDDVNHVKYNGKQWSISKLASYLLEGASVNGFSYFRYDGEILSDRRSRLEPANGDGEI